ncbi:phage tail protein [uncultured Streptococcus sp.]|uniref:phage tail protein n=1 Tax=uncultured Streptococcus sp. TaxID=83427 RepID=UPI0025990387|nr:phage tail protein [uncultured Streptococcus sp.]
MQIWIHDSKMKKIVALNNDIPEMLHYSNSAWHPYLEQATSTFDFTIPKFVNGKLHEDIKLITDECFVSFYINGSHQVFYIATLQEDDFNIQLTCNNTNLEYALEYANPFSVDSAQTIEWYLNHMDLLSFAAVELGYNEIPDSKRTLTFDSQETKMARLQSLMSNFDAEFEFKVELNRDGTYKRIVINIYQKADETHHGIGSDRRDVVLYYSNGLKGVQSSSDKTQMFNAGVFTGKDGLSLNDVEISEKNADGIEEFYSRKGNPCLYAPLAMNRYRATMRAEGQDNWIRKDFTTEYENINDLKAYALRTLKQYAYPLMTYTASVQSNFIGQYTDLKLGDTVKIIDNNFAGGLALEARVSEMIISFDNPNNNSLVFTNYRRIDNKPTSALQSRIDKAVEDRLPYRIELATTGGVTFKNNEGESLVQPRLYKGGKPFTTDVSWRWALDGVVTVGMQYLVKAKDIGETAVLTVAGYVGNTEVATTEITLTNVNDGPQGPQGPQGPKGDKGADGIAGKDGVGLEDTVVTYGLSDSETTQPITWTTQVPALTKGKYLWTKTVWTYTDNTSETGYQKTYIAKDGNDGADGIAGKDGVGIVSTTITYASSTSGVTTPSSGWYSDVPSVPAGMYLWTKTVWTYTDDTSETGYSVAKMGESQYTHFAYCNITKLCDENASFTLQSESTVRYGSGDKWFYKTIDAGTYTASNTFFGGDPYSGETKQCDLISSFSLTDSTGRNWLGTYSDNNADVVANPSYFTWQLTKGDKGPQGPDGRTQYTHIAYADNATGGGFSQTDQNKAYIGMYVDFTATDSTDVTKYKWTKWRGDKGETGAQGIQGPKGSDGRTPYLHIAYANSADGKTDFTTSNTDNKRYLGTYTDYTQADSTDPTKYKWVDMVGTVDVSARNLWIQSKATGGFVEETLPDNHITGQKKCYRITNNAEIQFNIEPDFSPRLYRTVTFSAWVKYENVVQGSNDWNVFNCFKHTLYQKNSSTGTTTSADPLTFSGFTGTSDWKYITYTYDYSANKSYDQLKTTIRFHLESVKSGTAWVTGVMVQFGNVATGHVWAPEDIQEQIDNKADQALTQDQLNALAEKNNLIKAEMEAKASVETVNQWITAYQNYVNANDADKARSEQALKDASERILAIRYEVDNLKVVWEAIDTYMSFQNEGLVIGKKDGSAYAKFSDDRISLFSGSSEVMYISQGTLNIANGIFTKTIQIGRFRFETHPADADMLVVRFVGG